MFFYFIFLWELSSASNFQTLSSLQILPISHLFSCFFLLVSPDSKMLSNAWKWYQKCLTVHPVKTQIISSGTLWGVGDVAAQTITHYSTLKNKQPQDHVRRRIPTFGNMIQYLSLILSFFTNGHLFLFPNPIIEFMWGCVSCFDLYLFDQTNFH